MAAELADLLGIADGDVVAVVGAGGKHTLMGRLADELSAAGRRVVLTTTTNLHRGAVDTLPCVRMAEPGWEDALVRALDARRVAVVTDRAKGPGMEVGLDRFDDSFERLRAAAGDATTLLVKADGARKRLLKAPRGPGGEPSWPRVADLTLVDRAVVVCALAAIGKPLDDAHVHRLEIVRTLCGDDPITEETLVSVAAHGYVPEIPLNATATLYLSHAVDDAALDHARAIAARVRPWFESVVAADTIEGRFTLLTGPAPA